MLSGRGYLLVGLLIVAVLSFTGCFEFLEGLIVEPGEPEITLLGDAEMIVLPGTDFVDPGVEASDPNDGDISSSVVVGGDAVDTNAMGVYVVTYDVANAAGVWAEQVTRTVIVPLYDDFSDPDLEGWDLRGEKWEFGEYDGQPVLFNNDNSADTRAHWLAASYLDRGVESFAYQVRLQSPLRDTWPTTYISLPWRHNHNRRLEVMFRHDDDPHGDAIVLRTRHEDDPNVVYGELENAGLPRNEWFDVRWVVEGDHMRIYVNDMTAPILSVDGVEGQDNNLMPSIYTFQEFIKVDSVMLWSWPLED